MKLPFFLMVFVNVHNHFRIWTRIRNPRVTDPDPAKVPDPDPQHWKGVTARSNLFGLFAEIVPVMILTFKHTENDIYSLYFK
jgi:hypothetical protein